VLSFSKILLLVVVIMGVFFAFRLLRRPRQTKPLRRAETKALDMRKCAVCGVYVGAGEGPCGKANCPSA
jgi:hypothetical protein